MNRARTYIFSAIAFIAVLLSLITTYAYGNWYSHSRYWNGTIMRVQENETALIRSILTRAVTESSSNPSEIDWRGMFEPMDGFLLVEVKRRGQLEYSNRNDRYQVGARIDSVSLHEGWKLDISRYQPPSWNRSYLRWLKQPRRWLEPSFDPITMPFLWFLSIYSLAMLAIGLLIKSRYLEQDVLEVLASAEKRFDQ